MKLRVFCTAVTVALCGYLCCSCGDDGRECSSSLAERLYAEAQEYQGRGEDHQAMNLYMEARQSAEQGDHYRLMGDISARIGDLHTLYYDYPQAVESYYQAYNAYLKIDDESAQNRILTSIAMSYSAMNRPDDARMLLVWVYNWAVFAKDKELQLVCQRTKYLNFDQIYSIDQVSDITFAGRAAEAEADSHDGIDVHSDVRHDRFHDLHAEALIQRQRPDTIYYNPMNKVQIDYLRKLSDLRMEQLEQERTIKLLILVVGCAVILLLAIVALYQRRLRKMAVDNYMVEVQTLQQVLQNRESVISDMNDRIRHSSASVEEMSRQINTLFKQQFSLLDSLVNTYYETRDIHRDKEAIYRQVKGEIAKFSDEKNIAYLEQIINRHCGNVIAEIRAKYPSVSKQNITLLCLILSGFSAKSIGILLDCSIANVHTKRSRLKRQLAELDAASGEKFANLLG